MRNIEIENTKAGSAAAIYTPSSWHCCRDAMLRVSSGNNGKATNPVRHCGLDPQSSFMRCEASFMRRESSFVRHKASFMRRESSFMRREASRLYISGDSDLRQNDGYRYTEAMSRMGLNMYNPLQAKRSWGYKMTLTLSELRSSSIYYHNNHSNHINHSSDKNGQKGEGTNGRMENNAYLFTHSLLYSSTDNTTLSTDNTTLSSLRGTKQSRTMKHKREYNDKGCMAIPTGILDCFATLAMTNQREGQKGEGTNGRKVQTKIRSLVYLSTRSLVH